jgi:hypothetical protein
MTPLGSALLSVVVWTGSAQVDVMIWEPGGEHPYTTDFDLEYREAGRTPIHGAKGALMGHRVRLVPQRIAIKVHHEVRGLLNCKGAGEELVTSGPDAQLVVPLPGKEVVDEVGFRVPAPGAYQIVLPRAVAAFACGTRRNAGDRWVVVGSGLFHPQGDVHAADPEARRLEAAGAVMRGSYTFSDASRGQPVRHDYKVTWDLRRHTVED